MAHPKEVDQNQPLPSPVGYNLKIGTMSVNTTTRYTTLQARNPNGRVRMRCGCPE